MNGWILALGLAALALVAMLVLFKRARSGWEIVAAMLVLGIAGYASQAHPYLAGAPKAAIEGEPREGTALVETRRALFGGGAPTNRWLVIADGMTRNGRYGDAAEVLTGATRDNPRDPEPWVALGLVLTEYADGNLTPAALYAYQQAEAADPNGMAAPFFLGFALARSGRFAEARTIWRQLYARTPADAPWRPALADRLARLDAILDGGNQPAAAR